MIEVQLTRVTPNPIDAIEEAASNCYDSEPSRGKIMNACYNSGHHSVLEFAQFTFHITGVSRALLAQLTRHRHASFAIRSQRYCKEDEFGYVTPPTLKDNSEASDIYHNAMEELQRVYNKLVNECHIPPEDARYILPNACETVIEISVNGRELIHMCNERLCTRAQWEIRTLFQEIVRAVREHDEQCAKFAEYLVPKCEKLGYCPETHGACGRKPTKKEVFKAYEVYSEVANKVNSDIRNILQNVEGYFMGNKTFEEIFKKEEH